MLPMGNKVSPARVRVWKVWNLCPRPLRSWGIQNTTNDIIGTALCSIGASPVLLEIRAQDVVLVQ
jgi:hypothetical protein